jgi:hypothetical protein
MIQHKKNVMEQRWSCEWLRGDSMEYVRECGGREGRIEEIDKKRVWCLF